VIYADIQGSQGPWLVFVHGFACDHTDWDAQFAALTDDFRCLRVDLRGHGRSADIGAPYDMGTMGADVVEVMRANNVTGAVLIGHSMGTRVVAEAFSAAPELVRALVFVDGSQLGHDDPNEARATINKIIDHIGYSQMMQTNFSAMFSANTDAALRDRLVARACALPEPVGRQLWGEMVAYDAARMHDTYPRINVPLLVLQSSTVEIGGRRRSLRAGETETPFLNTLTRQVPHAQVVLAPQLGHFIQLDAPELVNESIRKLAT